MCQIRWLSSIWLVKDTHNVILILVPSKWSIPFSGVVHHTYSWFQVLIFLSRSSKLSQLCNHGDLSKIFTRIHLVFSTSFSFRLIILLLLKFSWRLYKMVHQGFNSFSKCSSRFFSEELKYSLSCILKCNSFNCIIRGGIMSFLIIWVHVSWFTCC